MVGPQPFSDLNTGLLIKHVIIQPFVPTNFLKLFRHTLVLHCYLYTPRSANQHFKWLTTFHTDHYVPAMQNSYFAHIIYIQLLML